MDRINNRSSKVTPLVLLLLCSGVVGLLYGQPLPPGFSTPPLLSPKAKELRGNSRAMLVVVPPVMTNIILKVNWDLSPLAESYWVFVGTNDSQPIFSTNVFAMSCLVPLRVPTDITYFYADVWAYNRNGSSRSTKARLPNWRSNFYEVSWPNPPVSQEWEGIRGANQYVWFGSSPDLKSWTYMQSTSPVTNKFGDGNQFHRVISRTNRVTLAIKELWLLQRNGAYDILGRP